MFQQTSVLAGWLCSVSLWHSKCDLWFNCICTGFLKSVTLPIYLELINAGRASLDKWYTKFWWILIKTGTFPISGEEWFEPTDSPPYQGCQNYTYSKITSQRLKVKSSLQVSLYGLYRAFKVLSYQCFSGRIFGIKIHTLGSSCTIRKPTTLRPHPHSHNRGQPEWRSTCSRICCNPHGLSSLTDCIARFFWAFMFASPGSDPKTVFHPWLQNPQSKLITTMFKPSEKAK